MIGLAGGVFREDAINGGGGLLRKYDSDWEMRIEEKMGVLSYIGGKGCLFFYVHCGRWFEKKW